MIEKSKIKEINRLLKSKGILFDKGLSDLEIINIQKKNGFTFPPDLKLMLQTEMPISDPFVNWRSISENDLAKKLSWPYEGMCFDIEHNNFWMDEFGHKPDNLDEAFVIVKNYLESVPKLIPVYAHRYLPDFPNEDGNPILSVYQTDIIHYGRNLLDYFQNEFGVKERELFKYSEVKSIPFWSKIIEM